MSWNWSYAFDILPQLARAALVTVEAALCGFAVALVAGLFLAIARRSRHRMVSYPIGLAIEFVRSTPLLIQLYFVYFGLPQFGIYPTPFITGVLAFGLHFSTYISEVYRAGLDGVPRGQWEAATALNFSAWDRLAYVIIPQAIPPIVPALGNYFVLMIKDTPVLAAITVLELLQTARQIASQSFRYLEPLTMVGVFFLILSVLAAVGIRQIERRLAARTSR
ncbi:MAG: ectoine/hydroxyectoine ABC transporter permease subunit EhuD [Parvibaculaceae bacterium]